LRFWGATGLVEPDGSPLFASFCLADVLEPAFVCDMVVVWDVGDNGGNEETVCMLCLQAPAGSGDNLCSGIL
jgi:hypothetical protein